MHPVRNDSKTHDAIRDLYFIFITNMNKHLHHDQLESIGSVTLGTKGTKNRAYLPLYAYQTIPLYAPLNRNAKGFCDYYSFSTLKNKFDSPIIGSIHSKSLPVTRETSTASHCERSFERCITRRVPEVESSP